MPINIEPLDSSVTKERITVIIGKNILLKIIDDLERQNLLKSKVVKDFVSMPDLCLDDTRYLIEELFKEEALIGAPGFLITLLSFSQSDEFVEFVSRIDKMEDSIRELMDSKFQKTLWQEFDRFIKRKLEKMSPEELESFKSDILRRTLGKIDKVMIQNGNKKLMSISDKIKEKAGFEILVPSNLLICPKCKVIILEDFTGGRNCYMCNKEITMDNVERFFVYKVNDAIREVWRKNLWFEAYMARLLRRLDYKTWTSVHVMGSSGILHEVDVLGIRNGAVLIAECKTGNVSRNDVFNFCTKVSDLKIHVSILALIKEFPEPETREFVRKNPAIIRLENLGKMKEDEILAELEQRLIKIS